MIFTELTTVTANKTSPQGTCPVCPFFIAVFFFTQEFMLARHVESTRSKSQALSETEIQIRLHQLAARAGA